MATQTFNLQTAFFWMQVVMSVTCVAFSIDMIVHDKNPSVFVPVLTGITSYWLPSPNNWSTTTAEYASITSLHLFITQCSFSMTTIIFCLTMIYYGASTTIYLPIVTAITANWIPCPSSSYLSTTAESNTLSSPLIVSSTASV